MAICETTPAIAVAGAAPQDALKAALESNGTFRRRAAIYFGVLLAMWVLGFVNALVHAKDAWASMPEGLYLSAVVALLALVAAWIGYSGFRDGEAR